MSRIRSLARIRRQAGKLSILLIIGVALAAAGGTFAVTQFAGKGEKTEATTPEGAEGDEGAKSAAGEEDEEEEPTLGPAETVDLGEFLVNVLDASQSLRYVKADVSLVVQEIGAEPVEEGAAHGHSSGGKKDEGKQLPPDEHRIARDVVIRVVSAQTFEVLIKEAGREKLRASLLKKLSEALENYQVNEVLITGFVMQ